MSQKGISEQQIMDALRHVPSERWPDVLAFLAGLESTSSDTSGIPIRTAADLANSELVGMWSGRTDLGNTEEFTRNLREQASRRQGTSHAAGH